MKNDASQNNASDKDDGRSKSSSKPDKDDGRSKSSFELNLRPDGLQLASQGNGIFVAAILMFLIFLSVIQALGKIV